MKYTCTHMITIAIFQLQWCSQIKTPREAHLDISGGRAGLVPGLVCHDAMWAAVEPTATPQKPPVRVRGHALHMEPTHHAGNGGK